MSLKKQRVCGIFSHGSNHVQNPDLPHVFADCNLRLLVRSFTSSGFAKIVMLESRVTKSKTDDTLI